MRRWLILLLVSGLVGMFSVSAAQAAKPVSSIYEIGVVCTDVPNQIAGEAKAVLAKGRPGYFTLEVVLSDSSGLLASVSSQDRTTGKRNSGGLVFAMAAETAVVAEPTGETYTVEANLFAGGVVIDSQTFQTGPSPVCQ